jgi:F0F1-type ATP synthase membrane subunit c/vacuolar-type H+-ATPase subunit K
MICENAHMLALLILAAVSAGIAMGVVVDSVLERLRRERRQGDSQ